MSESCDKCGRSDSIFIHADTGWVCTKCLEEEKKNLLEIIDTSNHVNGQRFMTIEKLKAENAKLKSEIKDIAKYDLHSLLLERDSLGQTVDELREEVEVIKTQLMSTADERDAAWDKLDHYKQYVNVGHYYNLEKQLTESQAEIERLRGEVDMLDSLIKSNNDIIEDAKKQLTAQSALIAEARGMLKRLQYDKTLLHDGWSIQCRNCDATISDTYSETTPECDENCELAALIEKLKAK